ncbi:hypothetical protein HX866_30410 [Pseudomonas gingeri]|uniref:OmpA family protein n=1 Tax=Pseudomonas gingeri TaxID=117681 RepID=UPI0015A4DFB4|nr:OmpA family protein [Pseudomonas gingeri]NWA29207.1 hypothetical protein [Pseudomonas gingeri]
MLRLFKRLTNVLPFNERYIIGIGILVITCYCVFNIQFFPSGLSVGDTLVFVFAATLFGTLYGYWILLGFGIIYCLMYPFTRDLYGNGGLADRGFQFFVGLVLLFIELLIYFTFAKHIQNLQDAIIPTISNLLSGFIFVLVGFIKPSTQAPTTSQETIPVARRRRNFYRLLMLLIAMGLPVVFGHALINIFVKISVEKMGLSHRQVSLVLDDDNYRAFKTAADAFALPLLDCNLDNSQAHIIHNVDLLWHGVGNRSLVEATVRRSSGEKKFRFELKSEGVWVIETPERIESCLPMSVEITFDSYSSEPNPNGKYNANRLLARVEASNLLVNRVEVRGYSDTTPVRPPHDSNQALSQRRADVVARIFKLDSERQQIFTVGAGSLNHSNCTSQLPPDVLRDCRAPDRMVVLTLMLGQQVDGENQQSAVPGR